MGIQFAAITSVLVALALGSTAASAQPAQLPPGNITIVVPLAAGGPVDVVARLLADKAGTRLGRAAIVENRTGAAGNIGTASVARAEPNGLTWLVTVDSVFTVNPHMYASQGFDAAKDLSMIGQIGQVILMMAVNPKVPAKSWAELEAYSRTKSLNFGSAGVGSPGHLALEYLKTISKLDAAHVPFRGASLTLTELIAGNVDGAFIVAGVMLEHVKAGALRPLAVSDSVRLKSFPDVPTAGEAGIPDFEAKFTNVLAVPSRTPEPLRKLIAAELAAFAEAPDVRARFAAIGTEMLASNEAAALAWIGRERARWEKVVRAAGIKGQ